MSTDPPRMAPFGPPTRRREVAASLVVMGGAVPVGLLAASSIGRPPKLYTVLIAIGIVGLVAWLVDGRRFVAPGGAALGVGVALALGRETSLDGYALVFGSLGAVLLFLGRVNPQAIAAAGGFLVYLASVLGFHRANGTSPRPWLFPLIMVVWGGAHLLWMAATARSLAGGGARAELDRDREMADQDASGEGRVGPSEPALPLT